jgi:hypothetical protein
LIAVACLVTGCGPTEPTPEQTAAAGPNPNDLAVVQLIEVDGARLNESAARLLPRRDSSRRRLEAVAADRRLLAAHIVRAANIRGFELGRHMPRTSMVEEAGAAAARAFYELGRCARLASGFYTEIAEGSRNASALETARTACRSAQKAYALAKEEAEKVPRPALGG